VHSSTLTQPPAQVRGTHTTVPAAADGGARGDGETDDGGLNDFMEDSDPDTAPHAAPPVVTTGSNHPPTEQPWPTYPGISIPRTAVQPQRPVSFQAWGRSNPSHASHDNVRAAAAAARPTAPSRAQPLPGSLAAAMQSAARSRAVQVSVFHPSTNRAFRLARNVQPARGSATQTDLMVGEVWL
jgi:hypothetical protein